MSDCGFKDKQKMTLIQMVPFPAAWSVGFEQNFLKNSKLIWSLNMFLISHYQVCPDFM
jgi:hypothetical protein